MSTITFTYNTTVLQLPAPDYPGELRPSRAQVKNAALGGRIVVSDLSATAALKQPKLVWTHLQKAHYDSLASFIETTVNRSEQAFTFEDWEANTITVRYWSGLEDFKETAHELWNGTLELREVPA